MTDTYLSDREMGPEEPEHLAMNAVLAALGDLPPSHAIATLINAAVVVILTTAPTPETAIARGAAFAGDLAEAIAANMRHVGAKLS